MSEILEKWAEAKEKLEKLEERIAKYKALISKEMNQKNVDKLSYGNYTVSRRRNTRTYLTKESVPENIWKQYSTRCSFDAFFLTRNKQK